MMAAIEWFDGRASLRTEFDDSAVDVLGSPSTADPRPNLFDPRLELVGINGEIVGMPVQFSQFRSKWSES